MKMKKAMRGISFLLCLGFFAFMTASNAWALYGKMGLTKQECLAEGGQYAKDPATKEWICYLKEEANTSSTSTPSTPAPAPTPTPAPAAAPSSSSSNTTPTGDPVTTKTINVEKEQKSINKDVEKLTEKIQKLGEEIDSGGCQDGLTGINTYKQKASAYIAAANEFNSAVESVKAACNKYSKIKSEYNSCLSGGKGVDVSPVRNAEQKVNQTKSAMEQAYSTAESAISSCKDTSKASAKADKAAKKADKKENKALEKLKKEADLCQNMSEEDFRAGKCSKLYEEAYNNCGDDAKACKKAYNKWQDVLKLENKYLDRADASDAATQNAEQAEQQKLDSRCPGSEVWNKELEDCVLPGVSQEDIDQCSGRGYYLAETSYCYDTQGQRESAKSEYEYNQCLAENGNDESKCSSLTVNTDLGDNPDGYKGKSAEELEAEIKAAASGRDTRCEKTSLTGTVRGTFGIFDYLACKITTVVADVRVLVYILACFGMIAFAYGAIIGKINWKQLANMGIGLFILSMMTSFIEYFAYNGNYGSLPYGMYLPNGNHAALMGGSGDPNSAVNCSEDNPKACPDAKLGDMDDAKKSGWSWSDIKSAISSARDAVNTATNAYVAAKSTVETTVNAVNNITDAIEDGGNILDVAATIGTNIENVSRSVGTTSNYLAQAGSSLSNSIQDAQMNNEERELLDKYRAEYEKMAKKCGADCNNSKCNSAEQKSCQNLKAVVDQYTTSFDNWMNNEGAGGGATILAGIQQTTGAVNQGAGVVRNVQQAQNQGEAQGERLGLGGDLSGLLGIGYAVAEGATTGSDYINDVSNLDYRSQETKNAEAAADALAKAKAACSKFGGAYNESTQECKKGNAVIDLTTGAQITTTVGADGTKTQVSVLTKEDGTKITHKIVTKPDGSVVDTVITQNKDGSSKVVMNDNGKITTIEYDAKGNKKTNGLSDEQVKCVEEQGGRWVDGKCVGASRTSQNQIDCEGEGGTYKDGKCSNPKKAKCEKEGGSWIADGSNSKCLELSAEDQCARKESEGYSWNGSECVQTRMSDEEANAITEKLKTSEPNRLAAIEAAKAACEKQKDKVFRLKQNLENASKHNSDPQFDTSIKASDYECVDKYSNDEAKMKATCESKGCVWYQQLTPLDPGYNNLDRRTTGCYSKTNKVKPCENI